MSKRRPVAALLTDFGLTDHYVGVMKGVLLSACPSIQIIDITHEVRSHDIQQAAYLLWASYRYLPKGAIVLCIVDPGVGSSREIIGAKTEHHMFLAPQNGSLDLVLWQEHVKEVTAIRRGLPSLTKGRSANTSSTFHGRDIFAPLCARLASGARLSSFGSKARVDWLKPPFVDSANPEVRPKILQIDRFGNIITNIVGTLRSVPPGIRGVRIGSTSVEQWIENYASAPPTKPCLITGSSGLIEIVLQNQSAAEFLRVDRSSPLELF